WPVVKGLRLLPKGELLDQEMERLRRRTLFLGRDIVYVCLALWVAAGIVFPVTLHFTAKDLPPEFYVHFFISQTLCGLIAVSYPCFGITFVVLRAIYPAFLPKADLSLDDAKDLDWLNFWLGLALILAGVIPFLSIFLIVVLGSGNKMA